MAYRCIYCGKGIPPDTGLSCPACTSKTPSWKGYDEDFKYSDDIEPHVAKIMEETEVRQVSKSSTKAKEEFYRLYEQNVNSRKEHRFANQEDLQKKREGRILHMNEFLRLYNSALPAGWKAWYTERGGMKNTLGLFVGHDGMLSTCSHEPGVPHYVGFVQVPFMQEFEELHFDRYNVPLGSKRRGWRTIGLKSIESKLISEEKFHEVFGVPPTSDVSRRYLHYLKFIRTRPVQVEEVVANSPTSVISNTHQVTLK